MSQLKIAVVSGNLILIQSQIKFPDPAANETHSGGLIKFKKKKKAWLSIWQMLF